jgi:hypothetical protein
MILAANARQAAIRRHPSGWVSEARGRHTCPLCSRATMESFWPGARRY